MKLLCAAVVVLLVGCGSEDTPLPVVPATPTSIDLPTMGALEVNL